MSEVLKLSGIEKTFNRGTSTENWVLRGIDLSLEKGDYVTVIGSNGAGKSTLLNVISGVYRPDKGSVYIEGRDVTSLPERKRAAYIGRVFQNPVSGTASDMTIAENMALALHRAEKRGFSRAVTEEEKEYFQKRLAELGLGLETRLNDDMSHLSGGERQAVTLLMATLKTPRLLLLDEHTAALDPKTASAVLSFSDKVIEEQDLTALMITHNMRYAIDHGNRLIMMNKGRIVLDIRGEEKKNLTVEDLTEKFRYSREDILLADDILLQDDRPF